jgi:hypothetical protein
MKKIIVLVFASLLGFGMAAHAADAKATPKQKQVEKLRAQADMAHKKGDALTAQAEKLEAEAGAKPGEKMRSASDPSDGASTKTSCVPYCPQPKNRSSGIRG